MSRGDLLVELAQLGEATKEEAEQLEVETIPLAYSCEPEEVADVVAFLVGPGARYVTGVAVPVAGGMAPGL